jgi:hypothetical protein
MEVENVVTKQPEVVRTYGWYLRTFIADARGRGVTPIICTNVAFQKWEFGQIARNETVHNWLVEIARNAGVSFLPLGEIISRRYDALGTVEVERLFGIGEITHTNEYGAELNAQCVVAALKGLSGNPFAHYFSDSGKDIAPADLGTSQIEPKAIKDNEPHVTTQLKRMVEQAQQGKYDATLYTPEAGASIHEWLATEGGRALKAFGELKSIQLTGREERSGVRTYRYRLVFENELATLRCTYNSDGKITQLY